MPHHSKEELQKRAIVILVICAGLVVGVIVAVWLVSDAQSNLDKLTLCRKDKPLNGYAAVLIDKSDKLSTPEVNWLKVRIDNLKTELGKNAKLSLFVVNDTSAQMLGPNGSFSKCNPGSEDTANPFYEHPKFVQKNFEATFGDPLNKALAALMDPEKSKTSPILEAIQHISKLPEFVGTPKDRKLVIVSDMLQNVREYSQYSNLTKFDDLRKTSYFAKVAPHQLNGVTIEIDYLIRRRDRVSQTIEHKNFWLDYFLAFGASRPVLNEIISEGPRTTSAAASQNVAINEHAGDAKARPQAGSNGGEEPVVKRIPVERSLKPKPSRAQQAIHPSQMPKGDCLTESDGKGGRSPKAIARVMAFERYLRFLDSQPKFLALLNELGYTYAEIEKVSLAEFGKRFDKLTTLHPECMYTLDLVDTTDTSDVRQIVASTFKVNFAKLRVRGDP